MPSMPGDRTSFVVRVWKEPGTPAGWRGQVVERDGKTVHAFEDLDELVGFLRRYLHEYGFSTGQPKVR